MFRRRADGDRDREISNGLPHASFVRREIYGGCALVPLVLARYIVAWRAHARRGLSVQSHPPLPPRHNEQETLNVARAQPALTVASKYRRRRRLCRRHGRCSGAEQRDNVKLEVHADGLHSNGRRVYALLHTRGRIH